MGEIDLRKCRIRLESWMVMIAVVVTAIYVRNFYRDINREKEGDDSIIKEK